MKTRYVSLCCAVLLAHLLCSVVSASPPDTLTTARDVLAASVEATGGVEAWAAIEIATEHLAMMLGATEAQGTITERYPGYRHQDIRSDDPSFRMPAVTVTPERAWIHADPPVEIDRSQIDVPVSASRELALLQDESAQLSLASDTLDGRAVYRVTVQEGDATYHLYYDPVTLLALARRNEGRSGGGVRYSDGVVRYDDYRRVGDVLWAHRRRFTAEGAGRDWEQAVERVVLNEPVGDLFKPPATLRKRG